MLAKFMTPRVDKVVMRPRLFASLADENALPVVWISGPAGFGKTALVASYLVANPSKPHIWYQLDERDADPAAFFHGLSFAASSIAQGLDAKLPLLTPEYQAGLTTFTRNFFETLFSAVERPLVVVFDNYQDVPATAPLHDLMRAALSAVPAGCCIVVLSRSDPPSSLAVLRANRQLALVGQETLALTLDETRELVDLLYDQPLTPDILNAMHERTRGWAAGMVLLLEFARHSPAVLDSYMPSMEEAVFEYFATEVFLRAEPKLQTFLLGTAWLPQVDVGIAIELTGLADSNALIESLFQNNYFVMRIHGDERIYRYHPLFRQFLQKRGVQQLPSNELARIQQEAVRLSADRGFESDAAALLFKTQNWEKLANLVPVVSERLISQGKHATVRTWIEAMPEHYLTDHPWLTYWLGASYAPYAVTKSREQFERAYHLFTRSGSAQGAYLSWSGCVDTFQHVWGDFKPLDHWIAEYDRLQRQFPAYPSEQVRARVTYGMFYALMWRRPFDPQMTPWMKDAEGMLAQALPPEYRLLVATSVLRYYLWWVGDLQQAKRVLDLIEPIEREGRGAPLITLTWRILEANYCALTGQYERGLKAVGEGLELGKRTGISLLEYSFFIQGFFAKMMAGDLKGARSYLDSLPEKLLPEAYLNIAYQQHLEAWYHLCEGDIDGARSFAEQSRQNGDESGAYVAIPWSRLTLAHVSLSEGHMEAALNSITEAHDAARRFGNSVVAFNCLLTEAYIHFLQGNDEDGSTLLVEALELGRRRNYVLHPWIGWRPQIMAYLYERALEGGIEVEYVRAAIQKKNMQAPSMSLDYAAWPWPVKIHTLGGFAVLKEGEPLVFGRKAQKKPMELLKAVIGFGGRDVGEGRLCEALWPVTEGDMGRQNLKATVHRLRKLIGADALVWRDGKISLEAKSCWVDAWALERRLTSLLKEPSTSVLDMAHKIDTVLAMYSGPFLQSDEAQYVYELRDRIRRKMMRVLANVAEALFSQGEYGAAISYYEHGLDIDLLAESMYEGIMRCYQRLGRNAEGLAIYRRYVAVMKSALDMSPSASLIALADSLRKESAA